MPAHKPALHAIGNAHIDPVWLWRWTEGLETIRATFRSALDRMNEFPGFMFSCSSAAFFDQLEKVDPGMLDEIRLRVQEGRWEIVGGWWIEPDANIPSGEALVRQALYGQRWFQEKLGVRAKVGFNPDTFGHPGTLPQILTGAGLRYYAFLRPGPHEKALPGPVFEWMSPDGSSVLASRIERAYCTWFEDPEHLEEHIQINDRARSKDVQNYTVFYGVGNHGGGPTRKNIQFMLDRSGKDPDIQLSSLGGYFRSLDAELDSGAAVPLVCEELQHHARGCYSAHSEIKALNRRTEHLLTTAEKLATTAHLLLGRPYPHEKLRSAWQSLLYNQFHDILAGTSLPEGYDDARDLFGHARALASGVLNVSLQALTSQIDTRGPGDALVVYNPLAWPVQAVVEVQPSGPSLVDASGSPVLCQHVQPTTTVNGQKRMVFVTKLPPLGWKLFRQNVPDTPPVPAQGMLSITPSSLENSFLQVEIDPGTGEIISLFDKRSRIETLAGPANSAVVLNDPGDTWSHGVASFRDETGRFKAREIEIEESGPVRVCLRVTSAWEASQIISRLYLYRDLDFLECRMSVNWQEQYKALKLAFPLSIRCPSVRYEVPYGSVEREANGEEQPGQQWVDVSGPLPDSSFYGVALLNDCKYGFDCLGSELRVTVLRSPAYAHHEPATLDPAKRYEHIDQGLQKLTWRLLPHAGTWRDAAVARRAFELNVQPPYVNEYEHDGALPADFSLASADPETYVLTAVKRSEDGEATILRGYDSGLDGGECAVRLSWLDAQFQKSLAPGEILSLRAEDSGDFRAVNLLEE